MREVKLSGVLELALWLLGRRQRYRVKGDSMQPMLQAGDEVLVDPRAYRLRPPGIDEVVVARHPVRPGLRIVKRIKGADAGLYRLAGDNPDPGRNSPCRVPAGLILGRVTSCFAEAEDKAPRLLN